MYLFLKYVDARVGISANLYKCLKFDRSKKNIFNIVITVLSARGNSVSYVCDTNKSK